jgi:hypothetical protein
MTIKLLNKEQILEQAFKRQVILFWHKYNK